LANIFTASTYTPNPKINIKRQTAPFNPATYSSHICYPKVVAATPKPELLYFFNIYANNIFHS